MENLNEAERNVSASHEEIDQNKLSSLPEELLMKIIRFLPHSDLSAMMIVDKKFNNLASDPALWIRYPVPAVTIAELYGLDILLKVLESPRFNRLEVLDLSSVLLGEGELVKNYRNRNCKEELDEKFLNILVMASTLPLKSLNLSFNDLDLSPPSYQDFLAKMVLNIQHVTFNYTFVHRFNLQLQQSWFQLLERILDGVSVTSVLRSLDLARCDLDPLPISSIVKLNCLSDVSIGNASMREEQARALMKVIGEGSNIKKLDLGSFVMDVVTQRDVFEAVEPEIVAKALNSVEHLRHKRKDCSGYFEPSEHLATFFKEMGEKPTCLKKLDMDENNYYHVERNVIAKALNKLEYLEIKANPETQIVAILQPMANETKIVNLKFIYEDISWLNPGLVARAVVQVEHVDIMCKMAGDQIMAVMCQLNNTPRTRTRRLNLGSNDVSDIPGKVLENAVEILRKNGGTPVVTQTRGKKYLS